MTTIMNFFTVDTLQFSKRLQKAGLDQKIAEELSETINEIHTQSIENLATKSDLRSLEQKFDILEQKVDVLEHKIVTKMFLMLSAAVALITWLDKVIK